MGLRETILENIDRFKERDKIASDKELARLSGVPQSTFSKLRNQKQENISFAHIERLAHFFMTDPARFFVKEFTIPSRQFETHVMVAEKLSDAELEPLTQTGLAFLESRKKAA